MSNDQVSKIKEANPAYADLELFFIRMNNGYTNLVDLDRKEAMLAVKKGGK